MNCLVVIYIDKGALFVKAHKTHTSRMVMACRMIFYPDPSFLLPHFCSGSISVSASIDADCYLLHHAKYVWVSEIIVHWPTERIIRQSKISIDGQCPTLIQLWHDKLCNWVVWQQWHVLCRRELGLSCWEASRIRREYDKTSTKNASK